MDGCIQMHGLTDRQISKQIDRQTNASQKSETFLKQQPNVLSSTFLCISMIKREDSVYEGNCAINENSLTQTDERMQGRTDIQKDRQTDRYTNR